MGKVRAVSHVGLTVADLDRSLAFWRDQLGLRERGRGVVEWKHLDRIVGLAGTEIEWAELELPEGTFIELFCYRKPPGSPLPPGAINQPGRTHVCLEVEGIDALLGRLRAAGYPSQSPEPVQIPRGDYRGYKCAYVLDPDGVTVELSEPPGSRSAP
jgi:catechol 2,3-dioxygenase-like lactoylglutathione lyase family enzyme